MEPHDLRAAGDVHLGEKLRKEPEIKGAIERIDRETRSKGTRRHLLATALRLSKTVAPEVHRVVAECARKLAIDTPTELYVYPDSAFNAACVRPENGRAFVLFSSGLFEAFSPAELRFVVGHELGHHAFGHHSIPVKLLLGGDAAITGPLALELYSWARYHDHVYVHVLRRFLKPLRLRCP